MKNCKTQDKKRTIVSSPLVFLREVISSRGFHIAMYVLPGVFYTSLEQSTGMEQGLYPGRRRLVTVACSVVYKTDMNNQDYEF